MSDRRAILDANLKKLLSRSWSRAQPEPSFRAELKRRVLARAAESALTTPSPSTARPRRLLRPALSAAAAVFVCAAAWLMTRPTAPIDARDPATLLASGRTALRFGTADAFVAAVEPRSVLGADGFLEAFTPAGGAHAIAVAGDDGGEIALGADSHVILAARGADRDGVTLIATASGTARLTRGAQPRGTWRIETERGAFDLKRGSVTIGGSSVVVAGNDASPAPLAPATPDTEREAVAASEPTPQDATGASDAAGAALSAIEGRVFDAITSAPVAAFRVHLVPIEIENEDGALQPSFGRMPSSQDFAAPDGRFAIEPPNHGTWRVFVEADEFATWHSALVRTRTSAAAPLDVALTRGATIAGHVVDAASGEPIENALVFSETDLPHLLAPLEPEYLKGVLQEEPKRRAQTDARGEFTLAGLSSGPDGQRLRVIARDHVPAFLTVTGLVPSETRFDVDFELGIGGGIEGLVSRPDGSPWTGSLVIAIPQSDASTADTWSRPAGMAKTGADGRYRIENLPRGSYVVIHVGDQPRSGPNGALQVTPAIVGKSGFVTVDFRLGSGTVAVEGTILDSDGRPLAQQTLSFAMRETVADRGESGWVGATSDAAGAFRVNDLAGGVCDAYLVRGAGRQIVWIERLELPQSGTMRHDLRVGRESISGLVVDGVTGKPLENALVLLDSDGGPNAHGDAGGFEGKTISASDGSFDFTPVAPGRHRLRAFSESGDLVATTTDPFVVADGGRIADLRVRLFAGCRVRVHVVGKDGLPVAGAEITIADATGAEVRLTERSVTDKSGLAVLRGVRPGSFVVTAAKDGAAPARASVDLSAGRESEATLHLDSP